MLKYLILLILSFSYSQEIIGEGLTGQSLLDYVVNNYKTNTTLGYTNARDVLYGTIDLKEDDQLSCVYSGYTITLDTTQDPSTNAYEQGINCEHTWPQSMGAGQEPQKSDMHHLYPCKDNVNSSRGNHPYAESTDTDTDTWYRNDYSQTSIPTEFIDEYAEKNNGNYQSFEPREDHKGDASRSVFYFFAMYQSASDTNFWNTQKEVLLDWHYYDLVDEEELSRTWEIASHQEDNPNPFVLDSSLARRIWYLDDGGFDTTVTDTISYNIIINEIMQNPAAVSDEVGEWFEIFNNSNEIINLNGFIIRDEGSDSHTINQEFNLDPFSFAVLGRNSNQEVNGGVSIAYEYTGIALANGADEILLIDPFGFTVDSIAYDGGSSWPDPTGASMALIDINSENEQSENWVEYDSLTYGDGDYGTPGELNFPLDIEWDFTLSEPIITVFGDDNDWNPEDTISIKMELCNNSDYDHLYYPSAILESLDSSYVEIINPEFWFYMMYANTCDTVSWVVVADTGITDSVQVDFIAYPTILNCEDNPEFCIEGDTISFSIPINVEQLFDCTADDGTDGVELWDECYSIENTESLDLSGNGLTGSIPPEIGNLTNLIYLRLSSNQITGNIPSEIGNLTNLTDLWLSFNQLTGTIPSEIGNLINLEYLNLRSNQLTGSIPPEIGNLINLVFLNLSTNQLTGELPSEIWTLTNLDNLNLRVNQFTGEIPPEIGNLANLTRVSLYDNQLTGEIPPEIWTLTNLGYLAIDGNQLTGTISPEIGELTNLHTLWLSENTFTGSIPSELFTLENLIKLHLFDNQLTGEIPSEVGNLTNLERIQLHTNQFTGSIPLEIANLTNLEILELSSNQLTGEIPLEIGNLTNLTQLGLADNQLTGEIPESICDLNMNWSYYWSFTIYNNQLCPPYPSCIEDVVGGQDTTNCEQVSIIDGTLPVTYKLYNAYPNPFNPFTIISYDLPKKTYVDIKIYDISGRVIRNLIDEYQNPGRKKVKWDGANDQGRIMSAGVYLYTINSDGLIQTEKIILLK